LLEWRGGRQEALDELLPMVYDELRRLAGSCLRRERPGHTLQATALVHEAFVRLTDAEVPWQDRAHFFSVAARAMRRILVDHARAHSTAKRGGGVAKLCLDEALAVSPEPAAELLDLDLALKRLSERDARKGQAVELHFFGGLTQEEIAEVLGVSLSTVRGDLRFAKAWLHGELAGGRS
jgi:RNA polymerase sigma factor (TIGR02999 family)